MFETAPARLAAMATFSDDDELVPPELSASSASSSSAGEEPSSPLSSSSPTPTQTPTIANTRNRFSGAFSIARNTSLAKGKGLETPRARSMLRTMSPSLDGDASDSFVTPTTALPRPSLDQAGTMKPLPMPNATPAPSFARPRAPFALPSPDLGERLSWISEAPPPRGRRVSHLITSPTTSSSLNPGVNVPISPVQVTRYWFRCTHPPIRSSSITEQDAQAVLVPRQLLALLQYPAIVAQLLRYLSWADFSAFANANHVMRQTFDAPDTHELQNVVFARFVPGYAAATSAAADRLSKTSNDVRVSLMDLNTLLLSQQTPLALYPTQALEVLSVPQPQLPWLSAGPSRMSTDGSGPVFTHYEEEDEATEELVSYARAHSKFVAFLHHRASQALLSSSAGLESQMFDWRTLPTHAPSHPEIGTIYGAGAAYGGPRELRFPAPLAYFSSNSSSSSPSSSPPSTPKKKQKKAQSRSSTDAPPPPPKQPTALAPQSSTKRKITAKVLPKPVAATLPSPVKRMSTVTSFMSSLGGKPKAPLPPPKPTTSMSVAWYRSRGMRASASGSSTGGGGSMRRDSSIAGAGPPSSFYGGPVGEFGARTRSMTSSSSMGATSAHRRGRSVPNAPQPVPVDVDPRISEDAALSRTVPGVSDSATSSSESFTSVPSPPTGYVLDQPQASASDSFDMSLTASSSSDSSLGSSPLTNPHALASASNPYFAPVYRVFIPASSDSPEVAEQCEAQLRAAGVYTRSLRTGDIVANLGYVPAQSSGGTDDASWMVFNGRNFVRFDAQNLPLLTDATGAEDAIVAGVPCPTYYAHVAPHGQNPVWPLSIPVHLLPGPLEHSSSLSSIQPHREGGPGSSAWNAYTNTNSIGNDSVQFALVQVAAQVPSHQGPVRVQRFAWTARCDFRAGAQELGLWAGEWMLEAEGTPEGRATLERVLRDSYQFGYGHPGAKVCRWEVVLERCEGSVLWLRLLS